MVPANQIAAELPASAGGPSAGHEPKRDLRGSRLLKSKIAAAARDLGFDAVRFVSPGAAPELPGRLAEWLAAGRHGSMDWMAETAARRGNPRVLWPGVRTIVMVGMNYGPASDPRAALEDKDCASISVYARNRDYHDLIKGRLKQLAGKTASLTSKGDDGFGVKVFVDTAPVMEKPLAAAAGIGWIGRHTNLVSRDFGSWLFLGALFTTLDIEPDAPETDHCGSCRACLDVCPTRAFPAPYQLDARRCISYLTIENKGPIPLEFREAIGNRIYGCDDCLAVCPWNKFAQDAREAKLAARDDLVSPPLAEFAAFDDARFREFFAGSPVKRIGVARFLRNVLIAIGNSGGVKFIPSVCEKLDHESPLVRGAAVWALSRLASPERFRAEAETRARSETDESVRAEWVTANIGIGTAQ